jgi:hypothetical protein
MDFAHPSVTDGFHLKADLTKTMCFMCGYRECSVTVQLANIGCPCVAISILFAICHSEAKRVVLGQQGTQQTEMMLPSEPDNQPVTLSPQRSVRIQLLVQHTTSFISRYPLCV